MPLPGGLAVVTLTGTYIAADGSPLGGQVFFSPSSALTDGAGQVVVSDAPLAPRLGPAGSFSVALPATDNADLHPAGWQWHARVDVPGAGASFWFPLPSSPSAVDISAITPLPGAPPPRSEYVVSVNGLSGVVTLDVGGDVTSVNGRAGAVVLAAADVGAAPAVSTSALATTATTGFLAIPSCAGTPTGIPSGYGSAIPYVTDSLTGEIFGYISGSWKAVTLS